MGCRTKLAADAKGKGGERQYKGLIDVYKQTIATDGVAGLYRGFAISAVGISSTVVCTLACTILSSQSSWAQTVVSWHPSFLDGSSLLVLHLHHTQLTLSVVV